MQQTSINNLTELRKDLLTVYNDLRNGTIPINEAKEVSNLAGKIIGTLKVELVYNLHRGRLPKMDFLEGLDHPQLSSLNPPNPSSCL